MATKFANVKSIRFDEFPMGTERGGIATVTFDLSGTVYTGGADTVSLGGGGTDGGVSTSATLASILSTRARDGKAYTIQGVAGSPNVAPGNQSVATNGPLIYAQSAAVSSSNVTLNLFSLPAGGSAITTTTATWERAAQIAISFTAA
jgi:hypothetical protein